MPVAGAGAGSNPNQNRQTFKPPWVKEGPPPIPMPSQPWVKSKAAQPAPDNKVSIPCCLATTQAYARTLFAVDLTQWILSPKTSG